MVYLIKINIHIILLIKIVGFNVKLIVRTVNLGLFKILSN